MHLKNFYIKKCVNEVNARKTQTPIVAKQTLYSTSIHSYTYCLEFAFLPNSNDMYKS